MAARKPSISPQATKAIQAPLGQIDLEELISRANAHQVKRDERATPHSGDLQAPARSEILQAEIAAHVKGIRKPVAPLDRVRNQLPAELEDAARQLLRLFLLAQSPDVPLKGRDAKSLQAEIHDARVLLEKLKAEWPAAFIRDVEWFIAAVVQQADGSPMKFEDSGAEMLPGRSKDAQKWAGYGGVYRTLQLAATFLARQRALGQTGTLSTQEDKALLQGTLKALAAQRKARNNR